MRDITTIKLEGREIIEIQPHERMAPSVRHFGVALGNDEAQDFLSRDWRVFCDEHGPYLVVRLGALDRWPLTVFDKKSVNVEFAPVPWYLNNHESGVICWLVTAA